MRSTITAISAVVPTIPRAIHEARPPAPNNGLNWEPAPTPPAGVLANVNLTTLRTDAWEATLERLFGGAVPVGGVVSLADGAGESVRALATTLLNQKADMLPGEDGRCTAISVWWAIHAERAFIADW